MQVNDMEQGKTVCQVGGKDDLCFKAGKFSFPIGRRTYIMGILNVTPDSFSDGGKYLTMDDAMRQAEALLSAGADILDIGGESTRPGSDPVDLETEMARVVPVVDQISRKFACPISIDTYKSEAAEAALCAGACIINDINGLQKEPGMMAIARDHHAGIIVMHNALMYRKENTSPAEHLLDDVITFLRKSVSMAEREGLKRDSLVIDPGIGFGITSDESIDMIAQLSKLSVLNLPILVGPSRKRFIGQILDAPVTARLFGTAAAVAISIANGADIVRVHDVREIHDVVRVSDAICRH
ncbi:MAG: dihydropteroate synthase [Clostridiaceae bacterium]|nr:dihydropteroate synthase [Clostridiaceae bacterium]